MKKLILNRNKKQLQRIIEWKIQERKDVSNLNLKEKEHKQQYPHLPIDYTDQRILDGKVSILRWVIDMLENPKEWDCQFEIQKDDVEVFETIKN